MEDVLRDRGLDWTVVRPLAPQRQANDRHLPDGVRQNVGGGLLTSDVAQFMLRMLEQPEMIKQAIGIASS
jgi:hypothetical protein